jgi:hypothetical protein
MSSPTAAPRTQQLIPSRTQRGPSNRRDQTGSLRVCSTSHRRKKVREVCCLPHPMRKSSPHAGELQGQASQGGTLRQSGPPKGGRTEGSRPAPQWRHDGTATVRSVRWVVRAVARCSCLAWGPVCLSRRAEGKGKPHRRGTQRKDTWRTPLPPFLRLPCRPPAATAQAQKAKRTLRVVAQ